MGRLSDWYIDPETQRKLREAEAVREQSKAVGGMYADLMLRLEEMAAAYCKRTDIPPDEVVLVMEPDYRNFSLRQTYRFMRKSEFEEWRKDSVEEAIE